jgi:hypothetical protein
MTRLFSPLRLLGLVVTSWLPFSVAIPLRAEVDPRFFPPADIFRALQLSTLACGRENTISDCESARQQADPLLDHPRLPVSCKDVLWTIEQKARVAASNSFERRNEIDQAARDVTVFCRQRAMPQDEQPVPTSAP